MEKPARNPITKNLPAIIFIAKTKQPTSPGVVTQPEHPGNLSLEYEQQLKHIFAHKPEGQASSKRGDCMNEQHIWEEDYLVCKDKNMRSVSWAIEAKEQNKQYKWWARTSKLDRPSGTYN
jgi:hypothetical protein